MSLFLSSSTLQLLCRLTTQAQQGRGPIELRTCKSLTQPAIACSARSASGIFTREPARCNGSAGVRYRGRKLLEHLLPAKLRTAKRLFAPRLGDVEARMLEKEARAVAIGLESVGHARIDERSGRPRVRQLTRRFAFQHLAADNAVETGLGIRRHPEREPVAGAQLEVVGYIHSARAALSVIARQTCSRGCGMRISRRIAFVIFWSLAVPAAEPRAITISFFSAALHSLRSAA